MKLSLPEECRRAIELHSEKTFPEECCGALIGRDHDDGSREVSEILEIDNTKNENRERRFLISPREVFNAEKHASAKGLSVVGIYHSHPDHPSEPSEFDREHAMPFWSYVIVSCRAGKADTMQSWQLREDRSRFDEESIEDVAVKSS
ncbi:MAG: M67 family metallopeptidase [Myxococcota bacterium]